VGNPWAKSRGKFWDVVASGNRGGEAGVDTRPTEHAVWSAVRKIFAGGYRAPSTHSVSERLNFAIVPDSARSVGEIVPAPFDAPWDWFASG